MKLLFDANLSPTLVRRLADIVPGSAHVFDIGNIASDDLKIWDFARGSGYAIASKDTDFLDLSLLRGAPPKVILLRTGNVVTSVIEKLIRTRFAEISRFATDPNEAFLIINP